MLPIMMDMEQHMQSMNLAMTNHSIPQGDIAIFKDIRKKTDNF